MKPFWIKVIFAALVAVVLILRWKCRIFRLRKPGWNAFESRPEEHPGKPRR